MSDDETAAFEAVAAPVVAALAELSEGFDRLVEVIDGGGFSGQDDSQLVGFLREFEQLRNRLPLVDHRVIGEAERRGLPDSLTQGSMRRVLTSALRLSPAEASRRVRAAEAVGPRTSMLGEPLPEQRPLLAAAQREGAVTPDQVDIVARALETVDRRGFDPAEINAGEELLTKFATTFGPTELKRLADKTVDAINPDGTLPHEQLNQDRRHFRLRPGRDGSYSGEFRLTGALGAKLSALLSPLARPRTDTTTSAGGQTAFDADDRTHGQRMHDVLEDVCDRLLRAGGLPHSGGTPATLIVTITLEDLLERMGYGTTSDGTLIPTQQVLRMAGEADIIPTVLTRTGAVLDLGRTRRVASGHQTFALIAREGGCSFPGCAAPPEQCERHHIVGWIDGGATAVDNLTLLCRYHHHNFVARGWSCALNADGLPEWTPPAWLDRERRPLINNRIRERHAGRLRRRASADDPLSWPVTKVDSRHSPVLTPA